MIKTPSPPASRLAHSHPPSQHISSTRASACSAAVFGWAATGNQHRPHVRDAGARCATRARRARCARHPWGPSVPGTSGAPDALRAPLAPSVPHAPSRARRATFKARPECARCARARDNTHRKTCAPPPTTILVENQCAIAAGCPSWCLVGLRTAGHMPAPPPSLSKAALE